MKLFILIIGMFSTLFVASSCTPQTWESILTNAEFSEGSGCLPLQLNCNGAYSEWYSDTSTILQCKCVEE